MFAVRAASSVSQSVGQPTVGRNPSDLRCFETETHAKVITEAAVYDLAVQDTENA